MNNQLKVVLEEVREVKKRVDDIDMGLEKDRERMQNLVIGLESLESEVKQIRQAVNRNSERVRDKVADVVEPVIESTDRLTTQIQKKKMVVLKREAKNWWQKLVRKFLNY